MLNTVKKPLKSRGTNKQPPSRSKTLMVGKYYTDLSGGFFGNCWSQLKQVTSYPAIYTPHTSSQGHPASQVGLIISTRWLLNISLTPCVHVEVDEVEGGGQGHCLPLDGFSFPVLPLYQLLPEILPRFNLESERIWPDDPWPTSPIKPTLRAAPKTRVVRALWEAGLKSRQFPPGPPAAAGEIRDRRHGFLPTPLLHWGREKAHKFEAGPRSVKGSGNFLCRLCGPVLQLRACAEKMRFSGKVGWGVKTKKHRGGRGEGGPGHIKFMQTKQFPWPNKVKRMLPCSGIKSNLIKVS